MGPFSFHTGLLTQVLCICERSPMFFSLGWAEAAEPETSLAALREPPQWAAGDDPGPLYQEAPCHCTPWPEHGMFRITYFCTVHKCGCQWIMDNVYVFGHWSCTRQLTLHLEMPRNPPCDICVNCTLHVRVYQKITQRGLGDRPQQCFNHVERHLSDDESNHYNTICFRVCV